jgi:3-hydroxyacyl-CoA dehydrogenase
MSPVSIERVGAVARIVIDNPPVNALSQAVRAGLADAVVAISEDPTIAAVVLQGAGKFFIAGADISEFGKPPRSPSLPDVLNALEALDIPVVAAIQGAALGGGLETALACSDRIAAEGAKFALPETTLGILPGAGGTQRTPRLIGLAATLDLVTTGKRIDAAEALELGLVDAVCPANSLAERAMDMARGLAGQPRRRAGAAPRPAKDVAVLSSYRERFQADRPGQFAQAKAVEAVAASVDSDIAEGLTRERALFMECMEGAERAGLVHAFFAERRASKIQEADRGAARDLVKAGVIGGGTMGAGIAAAMLLSGLAVTLVERDAAAAAAGRANVDTILEGSVKRGKLTARGKADLLDAAFIATESYDALSDADIVVEAVFEDIEVKHAVFAELDRVCPRGAVLATNTSYLDINAIAAGTSRPEAVIGLHFFSPAHVMKLLEIVVAEKTGPDTVATGLALAKRLKKVAVRAGVCDGFIGNRIMTAYRLAADMTTLAGASPYEVDAAIRAFGFPMGPYQVSDLAGLDIGWASRKRRAPTRDPREPYVAFLDRLCELGRFGRKTGLGVYRYDDDPKGVEDPAVLEIVDAERVRAGIAPRAFSAEEIAHRYLLAMINEGAKVVAEGIALRPSDVDVTLLYGYGFPRHRGGPMHHADRLGLARVVADLEGLMDESAYFWEPAALLRELAAKDGRLKDLDDAG